MFFAIRIAAFVFPFLLALRAQTTVSVPCAADNTLYESPTGAFSNGLGESLFVGVTAQGSLRRALLRFDLAAALPANARVLAAELMLQIVFSPATTPTSLLLHAPLQPFGEGTSYALGGGGGQGAPTTPGDASWTHAIFPNQPWAQPGGDFAPQPSAIVALPTSGTVRGMVDAAEVQRWLAQPSTNYGWLLKTAEAGPADRARRLESRESLSAPPRLTITYLLPGQTGAFGSGCPLAGGVMQTAFVGTVVGGGTVNVQNSGATAQAIGVVFYALALDAAGTLLAPSCRVYLPLAGPLFPGPIFVADGSGNASVPLVLPSGFPGALITTQAAVLDNSSLGIALGNAAALVLP
jgi:hypothetical protein